MAARSILVVVPEPRASNAFLQAFDEDVSAIHDVPRVRGLLIAAAREREAISYSALLGALGLRFTRPRMRALCATLDKIDADRPDGVPELAVLVVRESDGLPGQGWWAGGHALGLGHTGLWEGPEAAALVKRLQRQAFDHWGAQDFGGAADIAAVD
jgi:hypothetical protein